MIKQNYLTVTVTKDSLTDSTRIFKVEGGTAGTDGTDGSDHVTAFLTNESHTFVAASDGTVTIGGITDMEVFEGVTNRTSNYTISRVDGDGVTSGVSKELQHRTNPIVKFYRNYSNKW